MIHWIWLLPALWAGVAIGIFLVALLQASRHEDDGKQIDDHQVAH